MRSTVREDEVIYSKNVLSSKAVLCWTFSHWISFAEENRGNNLERLPDR